MHLSCNRKEGVKAMELMEVILSKENLNRAYLKVIRNKGASGVDYTNGTRPSNTTGNSATNIRDLRKGI